KDPGDMPLLTWLRTKSRKIVGKVKKEKRRRSRGDRAWLALEALEDRITPTTPPIISGTLFPAQTYDNDATTTGNVHVPPDPNGAAGPNHLVSVVNTSIDIINKSTGALISQTSLATFFGLSSSVFIFDPKVLYDQYGGRFYVVALEENDNPNVSRIHLAQ